jgi:hypothetical protein
MFDLVVRHGTDLDEKQGVSGKRRSRKNRIRTRIVKLRKLLEARTARIRGLPLNSKSRYNVALRQAVAYTGPTSKKRRPRSGGTSMASRNTLYYMLGVAVVGALGFTALQFLAG